MKKDLMINGEKLECNSVVIDQSKICFEWKGKTWQFEIEKKGTQLWVKDQTGTQTEGLIFEESYWLDGKSYVKESTSKRRRSSPTEQVGGLLSPMPGKILKISVKVGDLVEKGQALLVMEAMKMEHTLKAPHAGTVKALPFSEGDQVQGGTELLILEESVC